MLTAGSAGIGAGLLLHYGYESATGRTFGGDLYDFTHPHASAPYLPDPTKQAEYDRDYAAYKAWESDKPGKGPDCESLRKLLNYWRTSAQMRIDFTNKWHRGIYDWGHVKRVVIANAQVSKLKQRMQQMGCADDCP